MGLPLRVFDPGRLRVVEVSRCRMVGRSRGPSAARGLVGRVVLCDKRVEFTS